jgi:acyl-CoA thioesterase I
MMLFTVAVLTVLLGACAAPDATATLGAATATASPVASSASSPIAGSTRSSGPAAAGPYLALGDSLAVGVGASHPATLGYVGRLHAALPHLGQLFNLGVGGETSGSFLRGGQHDAALHAIARHPPRLVTLDIGGNDLLQLIRGEPCASTPASIECRAEVALTLADYERNLDRLLSELRAALDKHSPGARLAVMTYFNPFSGTDAAYEAAGELALLGSDRQVDCDADEQSARGMNDIIACLAHRHEAAVAHPYPLFIGLGLELTHIGASDIHANDRGYGVIADAFVAALGKS